MLLYITNPDKSVIIVFYNNGGTFLTSSNTDTSSRKGHHGQKLVLVDVGWFEFSGTGTLVYNSGIPVSNPPSACFSVASDRLSTTLKLGLLGEYFKLTCSNGRFDITD
jgi:hypothetical protein